MAAHAIKAGEGDTFIAAGVECVSRFQFGMADSRPAQPAVRASDGAQQATCRRRPAVVDAAHGPTRHLHRHGADGRERRASSKACPAREMDEFAALAQNRAVESQENGFFEREITPVTMPDGTVVDEGRRPAARHDRREAGRAQAGLPARRRGHRRQRLSVERRRRRGDRDERHEGRRARASRRWPASWRRAYRRSIPRSWAWARSRRAGRR